MNTVGQKLSVGEQGQSRLQRQTAQTIVSHRGHPVTRLYTVASWSAGQTGGCLRTDNVFYLTRHKRKHMGACATL